MDPRSSFFRGQVLLAGGEGPAEPYHLDASRVLPDVGGPVHLRRRKHRPRSVIYAYVYIYIYMYIATWGVRTHEYLALKREFPSYARTCLQFRPLKQLKREK